MRTQKRPVTGYFLQPYLKLYSMRSNLKNLLGNSFKIGGLGQQLYTVLIFFYNGLYIFSTDFKGINIIFEIRISKTCKTDASKVSEIFRQNNHHMSLERLSLKNDYEKKTMKKNKYGHVRWFPNV